MFFVGDSAGHCFPLSGEGIRTAFYFGIACGRELRARARRRAHRARRRCERYGAFSARHARAFAIALRLQRLVPALPPRALTAGLRALGSSQRLIDRSFGWYLEQAHPRFAADDPHPSRELAGDGARDVRAERQPDTQPPEVIGA